MSVRTGDLFDCDIPYLRGIFDSCDYPWQILPRIGEIVRLQVRAGMAGFVRYGETALIGEGVNVPPTATIDGYAIIGEGCEIRPGAYIRGDVIAGAGCVIGNSTELKNCILLSHAQVPHYNYVGDSILGKYAHMGAGAVCSNYRADGRNVVIHANHDYETGLFKVGAFIGDHGEIGCGSVLNPGTVIGRYTSVYPLTAVRGVVPCNSIVKAADRIVPREER